MSSKRTPKTPLEAGAFGGGSRWSLATVLTLWYALSSFVLILGAAGLLYWALTSNLDLQDDLFLADEAIVLRHLLKVRPADRAAFEDEIARSQMGSRAGQFFARVVDSGGHVLVESPGFNRVLPPPAFPPPVAADVEPSRGVERTADGGRVLRTLAVKAKVGASGEERVIQVAVDSAQEGLLLTAYRRRLWLVVLWAFLAAILIGYKVARRGVRAIEEIIETARRIRSTTLYERIGTEGLPVELLTLAGTFNEMLDRLEDSFSRLTRFSADIAHELRTPLNNLRGEAEVALGKARSTDEYREVLTSCLEECVRLSGTIDSLLFLARAEAAETQLHRSFLDMEKELAAVRDYYDASAEEAGITLETHCQVRRVIGLDRNLFQRAVGNLVSNAIAYTPRGGTITLSAAEDGGVVRVTVADTGIGIPPDDLPHIFDRFYRGRQTRSQAPSGSGLGLAIVKTIVSLHGGSVEVSSEIGRGTSVALAFPAGSPSGPVNA